MGKKNKTKKKNDFTRLLKREKDDIKVLKGGKAFTIEEVSKESAKKTVAVAFDGVIAASADEAIKNKAVPFAVAAHYSSTLFKLFEFGLSGKYSTIVLNIDVEDAVILKHLDVWVDLAAKSNLSVITDKLERQENKLQKWAETRPEGELDMFVLHFPDIVLFKKSFQDEEDIGEISPIYFNLLIQITKGKKSLHKLRKKEEGGDMLSKFVAKCTLENLKNFGVSDALIPVTSGFGKDWYQLSDNWCAQIKADETMQKVVNSINFILDSSTGFAVFGNAATEFMKTKSSK